MCLYGPDKHLVRFAFGLRRLLSILVGLLVGYSEDVPAYLNEVSGSMLLKAIAQTGQTDRQTDVTERITTAAFTV